MKSKYLFIVVALCTVSLLNAQTFEGTNLSSTSPFYKVAPYDFQQSEFFFISFKTDPKVIRALVPKPLVPKSDEIFVYFAIHNLVSPFRLKYNEAYFATPVSLGSTVGDFIPVLYLDKVEGIIPGREIAGFNKVGASFEFEYVENTVSIKVSQMESVIISAHITFAMPVTPPGRRQGGGSINLKYIPSALVGAPPEVKQLTFTEYEDRGTHMLRPGKATLEFYSTQYNPLKKIPVLRITRAGYSKNSFSLKGTRIIHDYLKEN
jgi:acetoacetate decarboxylase